MLRKRGLCNSTILKKGSFHKLPSDKQLLYAYIHNAYTTYSNVVLKNVVKLGTDICEKKQFLAPCKEQNCHETYYPFFYDNDQCKFLCKTLELPSTSDANKHRPLLLTIEDTDDKVYMMSHSHFLKRHDQYNNIYITPDRTRLEHIKHKRVIEELKRRKANGEANLMICNGSILQRQPHDPNVQATTTQQATNTQQATDSS